MAKMTSVETAVDLINSYPIVEFVLNIYAKNLIVKFINEGADNSALGSSKVMETEIEKI